MPQTQSILPVVVVVDPKAKCFIFTFPRYFTGSEGYVKHQYTFWHGQHAEFFEGSEDYDRKSEVGSKNIYQILHLFPNKFTCSTYTNKQTKSNFRDLVNSKEDILYSLLASESSVENWRSQQTKSRKRKILTRSGPLWGRGEHKMYFRFRWNRAETAEKANSTP